MWKIFLFILLFTFLIVANWFRDGYIMGTAEDGLIFYDISHYLPEAQYAWMEHPGLGRPSLTLTAAKPTYLTLNFIQNLGIPGYLIQASVFWFLLSSAGIGIFLLTKEFFPKLPTKFLILAVFFYLFSPMVPANIWTRFLLNYIFFYSCLPLLSFIFLRGLKSKNYICAVVLGFALLVYSFILTYVAFSLLLWTVFILLTAAFFITSKDNQNRLFYAKYFLLSLIIYLLTNAWWLSQLPVLASDFKSSILSFETKTNVGILQALSLSMGNLVDIFRLTNKWFYTSHSFFWVEFFNNPLMLFFEFLVVGVLLYPLTKLRKQKNTLILGLLLLLSIFLIKGSNPPFGEVYKLFFENISFLQILRNPFEKFGFLLMLFSAPLFAFGVFTLINDLPRKFGRGIYVFSLLLIVLIFGFPIYTGLALMGNEPPTNDFNIGYKVKVPEYYKDADMWLTKQGNNFRLLGLPIANEGMTYNWEKGYAGLDLQSILFTNSVIAHNTAVPYYYQLVSQIESKLFEGDFLNLASDLNIRYIYVRSDIDFEQRKLKNPTEYEAMLTQMENQEDLKRVGQFGKLIFWENLHWHDTTFSLQALNGQSIQNGKTISFKKISPSKYIVSIKNNSAPFILVFSELFNQQWKAYYQDKTIVDNHFLVKDFANGWVIDRMGNFELEVEYTPQNWMDLGEIISITVFIILFFVLIVYLRKRSL